MTPVLFPVYALTTSNEFQKRKEEQQRLEIRHKQLRRHDAM